MNATIMQGEILAGLGKSVGRGDAVREAGKRAGNGASSELSGALACLPHGCFLHGSLPGASQRGNFWFFGTGRLDDMRRAV